MNKKNLTTVCLTPAVALLLTACPTVPVKPEDPKNTIFIVTADADRVGTFQNIASKIRDCEFVPIEERSSKKVRFSYRCMNATPQTFREMGCAFLAAAGQSECSSSAEASLFKRVSSSTALAGTQPVTMTVTTGGTCSYMSCKLGGQNWYLSTSPCFTRCSP